MPSKEVKRKFRRRGSQAAFAKYANVLESTVSMWLHGHSKSARLDALVRSWVPAGGPRVGSMGTQ